MSAEPETLEPKYKQIGSRPIRHDGLEKVTGRARFGADFTLPGALQGVFVRSPHAQSSSLLMWMRSGLPSAPTA